MVLRGILIVFFWSCPLASLQAQESLGGTQLLNLSKFIDEALANNLHLVHKALDIVRKDLALL